MATSMPIALFAGDICQDTTFVVERLPAPDEKVHVEGFHESAGGVACNAAVACARAGSSVRLLVQLGDDVASAELAHGIQRTGIVLEQRSVPGIASRVVILVDEHGEKRLLLAPGVSMYPGEEQARTTSLDDVAWLHTAPYEAAAASILVERCRREGIPWSIDLEPATFSAGPRTIASLIEGATTVFCNQRAAATIGGSAAGTLLAMGARSVVLTLGAEGVRHVDAAGAEIAIRSSVAARIRDTTGAGDCLAGWYVAGRLEGRTSVESLQRAVSAATLSCEGVGAQPSYPTAEGLKSFLARPDACRADGG